MAFEVTPSHVRSVGAAAITDPHRVTAAHTRVRRRDGYPPVSSASLELHRLVRNTPAEAIDRCEPSAREEMACQPKREPSSLDDGKKYGPHARVADQDDVAIRISLGATRPMVEEEARSRSRRQRHLQAPVKEASARRAA